MFFHRAHVWRNVLFALLIVATLSLFACSQAAPEEVEVTRLVKETVVQKETVVEKETVVQKETVVKEMVVTTVPEEEAGPAVGGTLVWALPAEPDTLDPQKTAAGVSDAVNVMIGASLVMLAPDGSYVPYLAESWEISDDGLVWEFKLKENILFHDGTPLTAEDFVWTFERAMNPDTASPVSATLLQPVASLEAVDDYTLRITLAEPFFPFLNNLASQGYLMPLSQAAVEQWGEDYGRHPVGVGPYRFKEWQTGNKIVLERNPDFDWAPEYAHQGPRYVENVEFRIIPEYATIVAGLEAGEVDFAEVEPKDLEHLEATGQMEIYAELQQGLRPYVSINTAQPPFDDLRVRQAFNLAVDRDALIRVVELGNAVPQYGPLSPSQTGYWEGVEYIGYGYDLEKAKGLMAEAGYTPGSDGILEKDGEPLSLVLKTLAIESWVKNAQILQEQYKALGVDIQLEQADQGILIPDVLGGNYQMAVFGITWPEADMLFMLFHSSMLGALNTDQVSDPDLDEILTKTRTTVDPAERQQWVNEAQRRIVEQAYAVPLYIPQNFFALNQRVNGEVFSNTTLNLYLEDAYIGE
jgi:peptide/nickel transport system substrate-binding protein